MAFTPSMELIERAESGDTAAIGRLITRAERGTAEVRPALAKIYCRTGHAHLIGVTGVPGSGKSTLVAELAARYRESGHRVAIIAIDPSSPYSGGAILGDRIRMTELASNPDIFIRSMATRGAVGGMAHATLEAADILELGGFDPIFIETVGVGQDEVEIARATHTTVVVSAPGLGDEIQAIKAGTMEIADIHLVSKCDRSDANRTITDLKQMLMLGQAAGTSKDWQLPVLGVSSITGEGFDGLVDALERHRKVAFETETGASRRAAIARFRLKKTADRLAAEQFEIAARDKLSELARQLGSRRSDPYTLASRLVFHAFSQGAKS